MFSERNSAANRRGRITLMAGVVMLALLCGLVVALLTTGGQPESAPKRPDAPASRSGGASVGTGTPTGCANGCGVWWGEALDSSDTGLQAAVSTAESTTGRRLDIVHTYHRWYDNFPTTSEKELAASGHALMLNWEPVNRTNAALSWREIADGKYDAQVDALAGRLKSLGSLVYLSFSHEPEKRFAAHGTAADFAAAFRHIHDRMEQDGARNIKWVWNVMGLSDPVWLNRYRQLWPGEAYVDWIAWDPYNWGSCRGEEWQTFQQIAEPFYDWLMSHGFAGKPFMLAEYGSVEQPGNPRGKSGWLGGVDDALAKLPNLQGLLYFDYPAPPANCDWQISTSPQSVAAFSRLAQSSPFAVTSRLSAAAVH
ncbi:hypothetical protein SAMN05444157_0823 [Frankineae bacterium MT45]|nr:hypothetical protein SAMN05444157_0823 [Frankineae bacterium MT45]